MASSFFHKPELALRRALELEGINQDEAALGILHEVLSSRRHRTWSPAYEQIMTTYLDLCLKLHRAREAKDGLHQYRNLAQQQAPGSLEKVIRHLMEKAEAKCSAAKAFVDAEQLALEDEEGFGASPQAILLSTMSTDPAKSQRDSALLLPSLKFLWETYRAVLDILRSNSKLEHVYHTAAQNALKFCRTYKRRMEFRHLCDMLRMHLGNLRQYGSIMETTDDTKSNSKVRGWEGWSTESIELHLQTRFAQLETASVLHRYTEGFRTVEDIYNVLQISHARRKLQPDVPPPKAKLMAAYYEKLTTLFWVSENHLFHAFAWYKYYTLCKEYNRGMSEEMGQRQASAVLLAALCIKKTKAGTSSLEEDVVQQKRARMATLLGFHTRNPTREGLLAEIQSKNILDHVPPYLRDLYNLLENATDPLIMVEKVRPLLAKLREEVGATTTTDTANEDVLDDTLGRYVKPLTTVLLLKLLVTLSAAYHTVSMEHLKQLTSGLGLTFEEVEKLLVQFTQTKALNVRMDHRAGCLRFGTADLEGMRSQLTVLAKQLQSVQDALVPPTSTSNRAAIYAEVRANVKAEHDAALERKNLIEKRKEEAERIAQEKIVEEQQQKEKEEAARKKEEESRIAREQRLRELDKQRKIQQELENKEKMRFFVAMGKNVDDMTEEQIAKIDTEALQKEHQDEITKKKEEAERKARESAKKLDYLVRAIRIEELPLIKKRYEEKIKADRERHEQETREKIKKAKEQWEADVKDKAILQEHGVFDHLEDFERLVMKGREIHHQTLCEQADRDAEIEAERAKIRRARKRKDDEIKRIAEEEARIRAEEERKRQEEERQKKEELRREREAKEEEARRKEEARMEEERRKKESQSRGPPGRSSYVPPSKRGAAGGGGDSRPSRFGDAGGYPGGGRYEGRGGGGDRRGGGGGYEDRRGGGGGYEDRRGGGGGYGDRRGGGGYEDRRGGGGYGDRQRGGGYEDRRGGGGGGGGYEDRRGGGGYGRRDDGPGGGGRGDGGRPADSGRWR